MFVSGYEFYKLAKFSYCPRYPINFDPRKLQKDDIVFLNLDEFQPFCRILKSSIPQYKFCLITHNSDKEFTEYHLNALRPYVTKVFALNASFIDPILFPIPLGFVDDKYKKHSDFEKNRESHPKKDTLIYMNFSINTNPVKRQECWDTFKDKGWVLKQSGLNHIDFYRQVSESFYILSPEGTGIDCHRIYESIYLDSIPILKTSKLDYFYKDLPVLIVDDWKQVTNIFLSENYSTLKNRLDSWKRSNPYWTDAAYWLFK